MKSTTSIEWTNHTINFWWGCTKVSPACTHCYAEEMGKRFGPRLFGQPVLWGAGKPRFERLEAARKEAVKLNKKAAQNQHEAAVIRGNGIPSERLAELEQRPRVFVNSMSDWLDDEVPIEWLAYLLETIQMCPYLDFQLLTKRPENWSARMQAVGCMKSVTSELFGYVGGWLAGAPRPNIWLGTTVENQHYADMRIPHLLKIPAKVRFLSMEPLSGAVSLLRVDAQGFGGNIHWVIAGGESGGKAEPAHPDWFRSLRDQCRAAQVPFFFKQWGEWVPVNQLRYLESNPSLARSYKGQQLDAGTLMLRVGVATAGNRLDGEEWQQFPQ